MKMLLVIVCMIAIVSAVPHVGPEVAARRALPALQHEEVHDELGQYDLRYVTAEGTIVSQRGRLVPNVDGSNYVLITEGESTYIGNDGKTYVTKYKAGLDGYQVEGPSVAPASVLISSE